MQCPSPKVSETNSNLSLPLFTHHKKSYTHFPNSRCHCQMMQPPPSPNNNMIPPLSTPTCTTITLTSRKTRPSILPKTGGKHNHPSHQTSKELLQHTIRHQSLPLLELHMHKKHVCISCNIKASKQKPGMYNDTMYNPEEDPYNSPLPLQWYLKPSTPNIHLCPECMHDSNYQESHSSPFDLLSGAFWSVK